jgi:hypothetical protein
VSPTQFTPFTTVSQGLPAYTVVPLQPSLTPPPGFDVFSVSQNFRQDMVQMWNFSIQRQITGSLMVEAAYVATKGNHLYRDLNINVPLPGPGDITPRRPFFPIAPTLSSIHQRNGDGSSSYHSGQFKVVKSFSAGFTLLASYTFSKSLDNVSNILYPLDDKLNKGLSAGFKQVDIPQNFVVSYSYDLPFGRGRHYMSNASRLVDAIAGGWTVNGITTVRSGSPLVIQVASSLLNNGTSNWANINCTSVSRPKLVSQWFDTSCFSDPAPYQFGNSGIGHVRGPGNHNWDFSAFKSFRVTERSRIEFRAEFFNIFNMAHFSNPGTTLDTTSFGTISSTALPPRQIQLAGKFLF